MKHSFKCLIQLLKPLKILGEIQSKSSQNFMPLNEAMYPNHRHGSHFLLFFLYELLMSLRKAALSKQCIISSKIK